MMKGNETMGIVSPAADTAMALTVAELARDRAVLNTVLAAVGVVPSSVKWMTAVGSKALSVTDWAPVKLPGAGLAVGAAGGAALEPVRATFSGPVGSPVMTRVAALEVARVAGAV